jgi:hypothetical protein
MSNPNPTDVSEALTDDDCRLRTNWRAIARAIGRGK